MKLSTLFWGILFILIGGLFLLNNFGVMDVNWGVVWRLWPLILVFWGLSLMVGKQRPPWYAVLLLILAMIFMLAAATTTEWFHRDFDVSWGETVKQTLEEPFAPSTQHATFRLGSGAGKFYIRDTTMQLVKASTEVNFGKYTLTREQSDNTAYVTLDFRGRTRGWNFGGSRNRADIQLNAVPTWDITAEVGAASVNFNLSPFKVDHLKINAGASSMHVRLGDRSEETRVTVGAGASSISIEVPQSVGCEVRMSTALSSKKIRGFDKISTNRYETTDFDSAKKKIYVDIEAGVSSVRVDRY